MCNSFLWSQDSTSSQVNEHKLIPEIVDFAIFGFVAKCVDFSLSICHSLAIPT